MCPIFNSFSTSFLMISLCCSPKCHLFCLTSFVPGLMLSLCTATSGLIHFMSSGFQVIRSTFSLETSTTFSRIFGDNWLPNRTMCPGCSGSNSILINSPFSKYSAIHDSFTFLLWTSTSLPSSPHCSPVSCMSQNSEQQPHSPFFMFAGRRELHPCRSPFSLHPPLEISSSSGPVK